MSNLINANQAIIETFGEDLFAMEHETRQHLSTHADGSQTLTTLRKYQGGEHWSKRIAYAQDADASGQLIGDIYDVGFDHDMWEQAETVYPRK